MEEHEIEIVEIEETGTFKGENPLHLLRLMNIAQMYTSTQRQKN